MNRITNFDVSFRGILASAIGVKPVEQPSVQVTALSADKKTMTGRDGFLTDTDETYQPTKIKQRFSIPDEASKRAARRWLSGEGELYFASSSLYAYDASVLTVYEETAPYRRMDCAELMVTFDCQPFRHLRTEAQIVLTTASVFNGQGDRPTLPLIKVEGTGQGVLIVNGQSALITTESDVPLYLDSSAGYAYYIDEETGLLMPAGAQVVLNGEWFRMLPEASTTSGYNNVSFTGEIDRVTITPRWRFF